MSQWTLWFLGAGFDSYSAAAAAAAAAIVVVVASSGEADKCRTRLADGLGFSDR